MSNPNRLKTPVSNPISHSQLLRDSETEIAPNSTFYREHERSGGGYLTANGTISRSISDFTPADSTRSLSPEALYTVACIDDSPVILRMVELFLEDKGFDVLKINDPVRALMTLLRSKPDIILLDITMPNLNGYEICSLLRNRPDFRTTPIIMLTGSNRIIDRAKAKLVNASGYLTKPFDQTKLLKMIFKVLK